MLSLFRDLPWPIILKALSLGIACKTLYVFYSEPSNTPSLPEPNSSENNLPEPPLTEPHLPEPPSPEPDSNEPDSTKDNSPESPSSELNSREYNVLNMKINILYLELIKIQPQLEKIQTTLDSLKCNVTKSKESLEQDEPHENKEIGNISNSQIIAQSASGNDAELNLIIDETHQIETKTDTCVEQSNDTHVEQSRKDSVQESNEEHVQETRKDSVQESNEDHVEQSRKESVQESRKESVQESNEEHVQETRKDSVETYHIEKETNNSHVKESNDLETPKSVNDKTCSFILRSGLRKGQSCNSKVKGGHQYCGMHR